MTDFIGLILKMPVILIFLTFFIRFMGQKELSQNTPTDLVYLVLLASIGWDMLLESKYNVLHIFLAMSVLTACTYLMEWLAWKFPFIEQYIVGKPVEIIRDGKWNDEVINRERLSQTELDAKLRDRGIYNIKEVKLGILEATGELTIKQKND